MVEALRIQYTEQERIASRLYGLVKRPFFWYTFPRAMSFKQRVESIQNTRKRDRRKTSGGTTAMA